jgi:hypothetical protein
VEDITTVLHTAAIDTGFVIGDHHQDLDTVADQEMVIITRKREEEEVPRHPVTMIPMDQEVVVALTAQEVVGLLHPFVANETVVAICVAEGKEILVCRCWCEMWDPPSQPKISKWPSDGLEMLEMCISRETIIHSNQKDLPLLNMLTSKWPEKHAMRWIAFESKVANWKSYLLRSDAKLLMK